MAAASTKQRTPKADNACVEAVDLARRAAAETAGGADVGDHLGHIVEGERVVSHYFDCTARGYMGWRWSVTVARAARGKAVTVDECVLVPGPRALLAPSWVPWYERVRPGDLGPGDLLPTTDDDARLVPGYANVGDEPEPAEVPAVAEEVGLRRPWMLSAWGRDEAADRWYSGGGGPDTEIAQAAPATCSTCGFMVPLDGSLGRAFGVCANGRTPFDGQVVSYDHGCGAHSDVRVATEPTELPDHVFDTVAVEVVPFEPKPGRDGEPGSP